MQQIRVKMDSKNPLNYPLPTLHTGFTATEFSVTTSDCTLDGVDCDQVALSNIPQTFTGVNTVNGHVALGAGSDVSVSTSALVDGHIKIDGVPSSGLDIDSIYSDTLFHSSVNAQVRI